MELTPTLNGRHTAVAEPAVRISGELPARAFRLSRRTQSLTGVQIVGCGSYVPPTVVTNEQLEQEHGFEPGWITQRSGILERRYASPDEATSDLCVEAARRAMVDAGVRSEEVDLVVVGTFTPDHPCPSTACLVQDRLNLDAAAFDVQAACSGFVYALVTAAQYVATGNSKLALVIGGDVNSRIVNPNDQRTAPLFGDGAGAVLLAKGDRDQGLDCYQTGADGAGGPLLECPVGGTRRPVSPGSVAAGEHYLKMDGRNVFKWAVRALAETVDLVLTNSGTAPEEVKLYLLHQANIRILNAAAESLGIPRSKLWCNLHRYGNTSAGSVPIALDEAYRSGAIARGDLIVFSGFGAGLTWGTGLFRW
jgi:3-oxoacyl-[acyl-carrier-protein] synthase-3